MNCLGVDIGYGFTKCYDGSQIITFPTSVEKIVDSGGYESTVSVEIDGEKFYAGHDARVTQYESRKSDFLGSVAWCALLSQAFKSSSFYNSHRSVIVLGVPAAQYNRDKVEELISSLKKRNISIGNGQLDFATSHIMFIPQGYGIFLKFIRDTNTVSSSRSKTYIVADLGYHTLDLITIYKGRYVNDAARSRSVGVSHLLEIIAKDFFATHGFDISPYDATDFILEREKTIAGETYRLNNLDQYIEKYCGEITDFINHYIESQKPDECIIGGGGVHVLSGRNLKLAKRMLIVQQPAEANAIGYFLFGKGKYEAKQ